MAVARIYLHWLPNVTLQVLLGVPRNYPQDHLRELILSEQDIGTFVELTWASNFVNMAGNEYYVDIVNVGWDRHSCVDVGSLR